MVDFVVNVGKYTSPMDTTWRFLLRWLNSSTWGSMRLVGLSKVTGAPKSRPKNPKFSSQIKHLSTWWLPGVRTALWWWYSDTYDKMLTPRFVSLNFSGAFPRLWFCISNVAGSSIYSDDFVVLGDFWACFTCCLHMNAGEQDLVTMQERCSKSVTGSLGDLAFRSFLCFCLGPHQQKVYWTWHDIIYYM